MDFNSVSEKISRHFIEKLPFVIYSLLESNSIQALFQKNNTLHTVKELNESGFVLAPFEYQNSAYFIPENESESIQIDFIKEDFKLSSVTVSEDIIVENDYIKLLNKTIETIENGEASKIVISHLKDFQLQNFSIEKLLKRLFLAYPTAFRYIWFHPKTGLWCGASPEILVKTENNSFKTMALAGTKPYSNDEATTWRPKEKDEQKQVTDMIVGKLKSVSSTLNVSDTYTHKAGSLLHIRTDITGKLNSETTLTAITEALHPTPAVCGNPQQFAQNFILKNEGYAREFYTGFLGPINQTESSATLMVNLRCMKIEQNKARIFVGGGITKDSNPKEEWLETQNKMQTMLQVLQPMLFYEDF